MELQVIDCPETVKSKMIISKETLSGIRITGKSIVPFCKMFNCPFAVHSFIDLVPFLFTIPNVKSFLSKRISQDPLDGHQRLRGGVNDNPNVSQFLKNSQALRIINKIDLDVVLGNCRRTNKKTLSIEDETSQPLKK